MWIKLVSHYHQVRFSFVFLRNIIKLTLSVFILQVEYLGERGKQKK